MNAVIVCVLMAACLYMFYVILKRYPKKSDYNLLVSENAFLAGKNGELETELGKVQSQLKVALDKLKEIGIRELKEVKNG